MITAGQALWMAAALLAVFWTVGAYNRLVALRGRIGDAFRALDELMAQRHEAAASLAGALREPLRDEAVTLDALLTALGQARAAADALRAHPSRPELAAAMTAALTPLHSSLARLQSLVELQPDLQRNPTLAPALAVLAQAQARLPYLRQAYNEASDTYNAARRQWPARAVALVFGLPAAGTL